MWFVSPSHVICFIFPCDLFHPPMWFVSSSHVIYFIFPFDSFHLPMWFVSCSHVIRFIFPYDSFHAPMWFVSSHGICFRFLDMRASRYAHEYKCVLGSHGKYVPSMCLLLNISYVYFVWFTNSLFSKLKVCTSVLPCW